MPPKGTFSGKQKKEQLRQKKLRKQNALEDNHDDVKGPGDEPQGRGNVRFQQDSHLRGGIGTNLENAAFVKPIKNSSGRPPKTSQRGKGPRDNPEKENERRMAGFPIEYKVDEKSPVIPSLSYQECGKSEDPRQFLRLPERPEWTRDMNRENLESLEEKEFAEWLEEMHRATKKEENILEEPKPFDESNPNEINWFEHNIETWRQLWRVCERSDIIVQVVDARFPLLLTSDALWDYVCNKLGKPMIIVLNKSDLVPKKCVNEWIEFLEKRTPGTHVMEFKSPQSSFRGTRARTADNIAQVRKFLRFVGDLPVSKDGGKILAKNFFDPDHVLTKDLYSETAEAKREREREGKGKPGERDSDGGESDSEFEYGSDSDASDTRSVLHVEREEIDLPTLSHSLSNNLMLGFVGHPNVGKSSMINTIFGRKLVSYSRTPGHTKHFQTLFLHRNVQVCDSPGVVFPALGVPKPLQVLAGCYPVAQLRKPFPVIRYLAERCVPRLHTFHNLQKKDKETEWAPYTLCEAFAEARGFRTKGGGLDVARAANNILRSALNGLPPLLSLPPLSLSRHVLDPTTIVTKIERYNAKRERAQEKISLPKSQRALGITVPRHFVASESEEEYSYYTSESSEERERETERERERKVNSFKVLLEEDDDTE